VTKIGLPETMLGLLPAWGGCTRLPRLIGLLKALDIILGGKTLAAKPALKCGLIDEIVPREYLLEKACAKILSRGRKLRQRKHGLLHSLTTNSVAAGLIARKAEKQILARTRGHYPAPLRALEVIVEGIGSTIDESLALEREAIFELGQTETCRNLIRIFFLQ